MVWSISLSVKTAILTVYKKSWDYSNVVADQKSHFMNYSSLPLLEMWVIYTNEVLSIGGPLSLSSKLIHWLCMKLKTVRIGLHFFSLFK